ncbi:MAG: transposase, partial [Planctomycetota bacterium]
RGGWRLQWTVQSSRDSMQCMTADKSYKPWNPTQSCLLPPSPMEWLPEGHVVYFILDVVSQLDLCQITDDIQGKDARGTQPYAPQMMVALLLYGYCVGVYSSRKLERTTYEDVGFRVLAGGQHPHFTTINQFRRRHLESLGALFLQILKLCREAGLVNTYHGASRDHITHDHDDHHDHGVRHRHLTHETSQCSIC